MKTSKFRGAEKLIVIINILNSNLSMFIQRSKNGQKMTRKMCQKSSNVDPIYSLSFFHYFREFKYSRVVPQNHINSKLSISGYVPKRSFPRTLPFYKSTPPKHKMHLINLHKSFYKSY